MKQAFEDNANRNNKTNRFLLTAAVAVDPKTVDQGYVVEEFCKYIFINSNASFKFFIV